MRAVDQQIILITGATDGLGRALARALVARGATVLVHGRDAARLAAIERELDKAGARDRVRIYRADFSALTAVRDVAQAIARETARLDVLINNAGMGGGPPGSPRETSADGYELRFAVNYLAPVLLTRLLLPLLSHSTPARIINVASAGQVALNLDDVMLEHRYDGFRAYRQSKLALISFTFELAERLRAAGETGVSVNALHPASLMDTKMVYEAFGYTMSTIADGVAATLPLVLAAEFEGVSGRYYDGLTEARAEPQSLRPPSPAAPVATDGGARGARALGRRPARDRAGQRLTASD